MNFFNYIPLVLIKCLLTYACFICFFFIVERRLITNSITRANIIIINVTYRDLLHKWVTKNEFSFKKLLDILHKHEKKELSVKQWPINIDSNVGEITFYGLPNTAMK